MSLVSRLRRRRSRHLQAAANARLQLEAGGHELSQPRLLGLSRCGRLRWTARLDGQPVKILECHDSEHAEFIEAVSGSSQLCRHFPEPLLRQGPFLLVRWIDGDVVRWRRGQRFVAAVARLQAALHAEADPPELSPGSFSYVELLQERWRRYQSVFPFQRTFERIVAVLDRESPSLSPALCHPDLTGANLVVERSTGRIRVIDNELLGRAACYPIDLLATLRSFGSRLRRQLGPTYLEAYAAAGGDLGLLLDNRAYLEALWLLVRIGAALQEGAFGYAAELARDQKPDRDSGPGVFEMAARVCGGQVS